VLVSDTDDDASVRPVLQPDASFELPVLQKSSTWDDYVKGIRFLFAAFISVADVVVCAGVLLQFQQRRELPHGFEAVIGSDLPLGAGVSLLSLSFALANVNESARNKVEWMPLLSSAMTALELGCAGGEHGAGCGKALRLLGAVESRVGKDVPEGRELLRHDLNRTTALHRPVSFS
jgi:hypothetical protein